MEIKPAAKLFGNWRLAAKDFPALLPHGKMLPSEMSRGGDSLPQIKCYPLFFDLLEKEKLPAWAN
jgi:hypothetical protein